MSCREFDEWLGGATWGDSSDSDNIKTHPSRRRGRKQKPMSKECFEAWQDYIQFCKDKGKRAFVDQAFVDWLEQDDEKSKILLMKTDKGKSLIDTIKARIAARRVWLKANSSKELCD